MLPVLLGFYSVAIDGARFNSERSRLNDALNQSVYAVAIMDNRNDTGAHKQENTKKVSDYMSYYLPDKTINNDKIQVSANSVIDSTGVEVGIDYQVNASQITNPIFNLAQSSGGGFSKNVTLRGNGLTGTVRRSTVKNIIPTDYAFVVDFSSSMAEASAEKGLSREKLLKKVVRTLGEKVFGLDDGSTIGIVPYSTGVLTVLDKTNYVSSSSKEFGCTYAGKMKDQYNNIDWDFWYNKPSASAFYSRFGFNVLNRTVSSFKVLTNDILKDYYIEIVAKANGYSGSKATNWLNNKGYCSNDICDADSKSSLNNPRNIRELIANLNNYIDVSYSEAGYSAIINPLTMDVSGTLSGDYLFNEKNVRTFPAFQNFPSKKSGYMRTVPFAQSCYYAYSELDARGKEYSHETTFYKKAGGVTKPSHYLVELTDNENVLNEFDGMRPFGNTDSLAGLLRTVPLLAKGKNTRKIIFVISDGLDNKPDFRVDLMRNHQLCKVIKDGLRKYPSGTPTTDSDIYYISLTNNTSVTEWANLCVGSTNSFIATNLNDLLKIIGDVMFKNTIEYINPNDI